MPGVPYKPRQHAHISHITKGVSHDLVNQFAQKSEFFGYNSKYRYIQYRVCPEKYALRTAHLFWA